MLNLSEACKGLYMVTEPFRYHFVLLSWEWALYFLLRTLSERPDLAVRVSEVEISSVNRVPPTALCELNSICGSPTWQYSVAPNRPADLILVLLQLVPKLERLHFPVHGIGLFGNLSQSSLLTSSSTSIKTLAFSGSDHEYLLDQAVPVMQRTPNLEVLLCYRHARVTGLFAASLACRTPAEPFPLHNLTELALVDTSITEPSFCSLLSAVGSRLLRVNIRRTARMPSLDDEHRVVGFDDVLAALQPWRRTLKELSFTMHGLDRMALSQGSHRLRGVRLLREFRSLEVLWAQAAFFDFLGHLRPREDALKSTLPTSIRELRLFGHGNFAPALQGLLGTVMSGQFADLRTVEIDDQGPEGYEPDGEEAQNLRDVGASFRSAGVTFTVHPQPEEFQVPVEPEVVET